MRPRLSSVELESVVEALALASARADRDHVLLQGLLRCGVAQAAALWRLREADVERGRPAQWHCVRAIGPVEALPSLATQAAHVASDVAIPLPANVLRLRTETVGSGAPQLFIAGCEPDSEQSDLAEALFLIWRASDTTHAHEFLDVAAGLLPAQRDASTPKRSELFDVAPHVRATPEPAPNESCLVRVELAEALRVEAAALQSRGVELAIDLDDMPADMRAPLDAAALRTLLSALLAEARHASSSTAPALAAPRLYGNTARHAARASAWSSAGPAGGWVLVLDTPARATSTHAASASAATRDAAHSTLATATVALRALGGACRSHARPDGGTRRQIWLPAA